MKVYFVQHGIAQSKEMDANRPLTETGQAETRRIATHLQQQGIKISHVFHSGKLRAAETAAIFSTVLGTPESTAISGMGPNDDTRLLIDHLQQKDALYVGHLPHMQRVVSRLLTGDESTNTIHFQNSAAACVELTPTGNSLIWFLTPEVC